MKSGGVKATIFRLMYCKALKIAELYNPVILFGREEISSQKLTLESMVSLVRKRRNSKKYL